MERCLLGKEESRVAVVVRFSGVLLLCCNMKCNHSYDVQLFVNTVKPVYSANCGVEEGCPTVPLAQGRPPVLGLRAITDVPGVGVRCHCILLL